MLVTSEVLAIVRGDTAHADGEPATGQASGSAAPAAPSPFRRAVEQLLLFFKVGSGCSPWAQERNLCWFLLVVSMRWGL